MKKIYYLLVLILSTSSLAAQEGVCTGNLGENIFERGDFGSGTDPVLLSDPMIAPGYNYSTVVPFDGSYSICSRSNALAGLYNTWLQISDNSNDPNGYMMVVNASFEPGIFYEETVDGLCENTLYEFSADIINIVKNNVPNHSDPNVTFLIDDVTQYSTGNIPKTENWDKYGFSFVTTETQTSLKLTIRNNAPGGTGNDLALDNISFRPCGPSSFIGIENEDETIFLCIDDDPLTVVADIEGSDGTDFAIQWESSVDGEVWQEMVGSTANSIIHSNFDPGDYYYRYLSAGSEINLQNTKCRIISDEIKITILPDTYSVQDTICQGLEYAFGTQVLTDDGFYTENFESIYGCDSTVLLDLVFEESRGVILDIDLEDPSCYDFDDGNIIINDISGGNGNLSYQVTDSSGNFPVLNYSAGTYTLEITDKYLCQYEETLILINPDELRIDVGKDTTLKLGTEIDIIPEYSTLFNSLEWQGTGTFDCLDCNEVIFLPYVTSVVSLMGIDENGCETQDSMFIIVDEGDLIHFPNVFSPNGDRINDHFTINFFGRSVKRVNKFRIYDRWGGLLVDGNNFDVASGDALWDGYVDNSIVPNGVYGFYIEVVYINEVVDEYRGSFTVVR